MNDNDERFANLSPLKRALLAIDELQAEVDALQNERTEPIAVIGMSCRFPGGAVSPEAFWDLLRTGQDGIIEVPPARWDMDEYYDPNPNVPGKMYIRHGGFLREPVDQFDALFFGISPREAASMDPQQRLLLELAWEALENAGQPTDQLVNSLTGVFVGLMTNDYGQGQQWSNVNSIDPYTGSGSGFSFAAGRLSYVLGLQGPSMAVDTACSSSLVSTHLACQSLRARECDMALSGGVNLMLSPYLMVYMCKMNALAPDGHCKTFDEAANGYGRSEGGGMLVLKRLSDAIAANDPILGVIRGSAVNHDGPSGGLTVPSGPAQQAVIRKAMTAAGVEPGQVGYVEAHGTGTSLGDPIEMRALASVMRKGYTHDQPLFVGSLKTNLGHMEAAAGMGGLIKTILTLQHGQIPPHLHFHKPSSYISWKDLPVKVPTELTAWPAYQAERIAGVSGFGLSGINAHVILQAPPAAETLHEAPPEITGRFYLLPISARTPQALQSLAQSYQNILNPSVDLANLVYSASKRRSHQDQRLTLAFRTSEELNTQLSAFLSEQRSAGVETGRRQPGRYEKAVFVFPGQGGQWLGMGRDLLGREPVFRSALEACEQAFRPHVNWSLLEQIAADAAEKLEDISIIQPMIFAIQVALARLWQSWGIQPAAVVGHSLGEVAAAHIAGALTLEDAARIICVRSRLMRRTSGQGGMAVVELSFEQAQSRVADCGGRVVAAVSNSPRATVLSGDKDVLNEILTQLQADGIYTRLVKVDVASHSPHMDALLEELRQAIATIRPVNGQIPFYSTVNKAVCTGAELNVDYWVRNLRSPVLFQAAIERLAQDSCELFIELSPHPTLLPSIEDCFRPGGRTPVLLPSMQRDELEIAVLLNSLGKWYVNGGTPNWQALYPQDAHWMPLPNYPWQRQHHWLNIPAETGQRDPHAHPLLGKVRELAQSGGTYCWECTLNTADLPYLKDHQVTGAVILPAAAYLEMAFAAARQVFKTAPFALEQIHFEKALPLPEQGGLTIQFTLQDASSEQPRFTIASRANADAEWVVHAHGRIQKNVPKIKQSALNPGAYQQGDSLAGAAHYQQMQAGGLEYGPAFQGVTEVWRADGQALGRLSLPESAQSRPVYQVHPAFLDAAIQLIGQTQNSAEAGVYVPVGLDAAYLFAQPTAQAWGLATLTTAASGQPSWNIALYSDEGQPQILLRGLQVQRLDQPSRDAASWQNWLYQLKWTETPFTADATPNFTEAMTGNWLVCASTQDPIALQLTAALQRVGAACTHCPPGNLAENWLREQPLGAAGQLHGLIYLAGESALPDGTGEALAAQARQSCVDLLTLLQIMAQKGWRDAPRLWIVTQGAQAVGDSTSTALLQAPLWGLGRVVMHEHPEFACTQIDLAAQIDPAEGARMVEAEMSAAIATLGTEDQLAWRADKRYVARLERWQPENLAPLPLTRAGQRPFRLEINRMGILDQLAVRAMHRSAPGADEVEIEVRAAGLNFLDVLGAMGIRPDAQGGQVPPLGSECAGVITALGANVSNWQIGDEVLAFAPYSFATHAVAHARLVARKPAHLSWEQAAGLPVVYLTAHYALHNLAHLKAGERVLIHSATGGTGLAALKIAQKAGAIVFATAGTPEKRAYLQQLGVEYVMDSRTLAFADQIMEWTHGHGVDVVLNSLTGEAIAKGMASLAPYGRFIEIGKRDIYSNNALALGHFRRSLSYHAVDLAGMGRDKPALLAELFVEVINIISDGSYPALPVEIFPLAQGGEAFRRMAQARHQGKIILNVQEPGSTLIQSRPSGRLRSDGVYLVTGGLGGIGLKVASWLLDQGIRHLILVGRRGANADAQAAVEQLRQAGAQVEVVAADVASSQEMDALFNRIDASGQPLRGVFHAAGLLEDGVLMKQTSERFASVMAPKIAGAWNLYTRIKDRDLDAFVLFSSAAALLGSPGQGNYAAANGFLDALAAFATHQGTPSISIHWGPWAEVGLAAAQGNRGERLTGQGMGSIDPAGGIAAMAYLLGQDAVQAAVLPINFRQWRQIYPKVAQIPLLGDLFDQEDAGNDGGAASDFLKNIETAEPHQRLALLETYIVSQLAQVLRLSAEQINRESPLQTLGLDSLMALELRNRLENSLGLTLSVTLIWNHPTVAALAAFLLEKLNLTPETPPAPAAVEAPAPAASFSGSERELVLKKLAEIKKRIGN